MNEQDRIRLAEAMGWTRISMKYVAMDERSYPFGCPPSTEYTDGLVNPKYREQIPNPFTNANDDYAVLEWMREQSPRLFTPTFWRKLNLSWIASACTPGDYARAALKVLDNETT